MNRSACTVVAAAVICLLLFAGCTVSRPAEPVSPDPGPATQTSGPAVQPSGPAAQPSGSTAQTPGAVSPGTESAAGRFYTEDGTVFSDLEGYLYYLEGDFWGMTDYDNVRPPKRMELYECKPYMSDWKGYAWGLAFLRENTMIKEMYLVDIGAASLNDNTEIYRVEYEGPDADAGGFKEGDNVWYMITYVCDTENGDRIGPKVIGVLPLDAMRQYTSHEWIDEYYCPARAAAMDARSGYLQRFAYDEENKNPWQICGAEYDIDGDGSAEKISVTYGNTSGIFSFIVTISGERGFEHQSAFTAPHGDIELVEFKEGLRLTLQPRTSDSKLSDGILVYEIIPDGGRVILRTFDGSELSNID